MANNRNVAEVVIRLENLTKSYGRRRGVQDLNFEIGRGQVFGYLGPNGAGKTTTIRVLMDFIRPTRGQVQVFGLDLHLNVVEVHRRIGYLPGELSVYGDLTGSELLSYLSNLRGGVDKGYLKVLSEQLDCDLSRPLRTLSHGNRQKVGLIQAFMHRPELLILDEPTSGLDPLMRKEFYSLVADAKREGRTVFLSSHILPEIERICDRVGMIREGRLVAVDEVATLKLRIPKRLEVQFASPVSADAFHGLPGIRDVELKDSVLRCAAFGSVDALFKAASQFEVINIASQEPSLEEIFLTYYEDTGKRHAA